jgi:hypothetical protein
MLAKRLGLHVSRLYTDNDISATNGRVRPEFQRMLRDRPAAIVAWHQDRLLRLTSDLEKVIDLGVNVHFVTAGMLDLSTPAGRAVARTVAAWSQYEGEQKSLRQQSANLQRAERGTGSSRVGHSATSVWMGASSSFLRRLTSCARAIGGTTPGSPTTRSPPTGMLAASRRTTPTPTKAGTRHGR